jgi:putative transposase
VHVVHRGNNRHAIFRDEADFQYFKGCLSCGLSKSASSMHCYVLMGNHFHLLLTPSHEKGISDAMHIAIRRYSGYFNERYTRTGTLWEGRFHASVIDTDRYLIACHRYIELNPVRAGVVQSPEAYRWSSHRALAFGIRDELIRPHSCIFPPTEPDHARRESYRRLFAEAGADADWEDIRGALLGGRRLPSVERRKRGRPPNSSLARI